MEKGKPGSSSALITYWVVHSLSINHSPNLLQKVFYLNLLSLDAWKSGLCLDKIISLHQASPPWAGLGGGAVQVFQARGQACVHFRASAWPFVLSEGEGTSGPIEHLFLVFP